jgi:hypothetical protein
MGARGDGCGFAAVSRSVDVLFRLFVHIRLVMSDFFVWDLVALERLWGGG